MLRTVLLRLAQESAPADGQARTEREFTYYGQIDPARIKDELARAESAEEQEQWGLRIGADHPQDDQVQEYAGEVRVRRCKQAGKPATYVLTSKAFRPYGDSAKKEAEIEITQDLFELIRTFAPQGMHKVRYRFPRPDGLVWEVDMYLVSTQGEHHYHTWCKVDLEVPGDRTAPQDFPITLTNVINGDYRKRTPQERKQVTELMERVFITRNRFLRDPAG